jgi:hypothetical protein
VDSFSGALESVFMTALARARCSRTPFDSWLTLAGEGGPTPAQGPLRHDIVLPSPGRRRLGLNVFPGAVSSERIVAAARAWAGANLGPGGEEAMAHLCSARGVSWTAGALVDGDEPRLKLYASGRGLEALARDLGVDGGASGVVAVGVDVTLRGIERARIYLTWEGGRQALDGWNAPALPALAGVSHLLVTLLGNEKRSVNVIFGPQASLDDLRAAAAAFPLPSCLDDVLLAEMMPPGWVLRPVAYEIDLYRDRRESEALVTIAAAS